MRKAKRVSAEEFVRAYMRGRDIDSIASKLGLTPTYVTYRAYKLRKVGVRIPGPTEKRLGHSRRSPRVRVDRLNEIVKEEKKLVFA